MKNNFTKITIWVILILLTLALVLPSILPIFERSSQSSISAEQLQQIQNQIKINNISTTTAPASSEAERVAEEERLNTIQKEAEETLKKSSEEAAR